MLETTRFYLIALTILVVAAGCSGPLEMTVSGTSDMNSGGNAAVVRIYQLTNTTNFQQTPIESFWRDDRAALGDEMVGQSVQVRLFPNESQTVSIELEDATQYIGVAADLRRPDANQWRRIYSVEELKGENVRVRIEENRVTVNVE